VQKVLFARMEIEEGKDVAQEFTDVVKCVGEGQRNDYSMDLTNGGMGLL